MRILLNQRYHRDTGLAVKSPQPQVDISLIFSSSTWYTYIESCFSSGWPRSIRRCLIRQQILYTKYLRPSKFPAYFPLRRHAPRPASSRLRIPEITSRWKFRLNWRRILSRGIFSALLDKHLGSNVSLYAREDCELFRLVVATRTPALFLSRTVYVSTEIFLPMVHA